MKRLGWATTALLVLAPATVHAEPVTASPGASPSAVASAASPAPSSPAPSASGSAAATGTTTAVEAVIETGKLITVNTPWDPSVAQRINDLLKAGESRLQAAADKGDKGTYEDAFLVWDAMVGDIDVIGSQASWDFNTSTDKDLRDRSEKTEEVVGKVLSRLYTLRYPYDILKKTSDRTASTLSWDRQSFATDTLKSFEQNGVHLEGAPKDRVKAIDKELIELSTRFSKVLKDRDVLVPVTTAQAKHLAKDAQKFFPKTSKRMAIIREDSYLDIMRQHPDRDFRRLVYTEFYGGTKDQVSELDTMRKLREEKAKLTKGKSYAALEVEDEGFTVQKVRETLKELQTRTETAFKATLVDYKKLNKGQDPKSYDLLYLEETAPTAGIKPEVLLQYFTAERAVSTLLDLSQKLYGLKFEKTKSDAKTRVDVYEVKDASGKSIGVLTLDLFPREFKYSHAACWTIQGRATHLPDRMARIGLVSNMHEKDLPGGGKGVLFDELQTVFHEFGHVVHGFLINAEPIGAHHVARSLVEVPSQVFESWALDPKVLDTMAVHYKTGKPIPENLRKVLYRKSQRFAARHVRTQTLYASFDLDFHENTGTPAQELWDKLTTELYGEGFYPPGVPWYTRFGHLDGYGAKYWGYKFADLGKSQMYWNLVHQFPDLLSADCGKKINEGLMLFGGLKKLPAVAKDFTGIELTALPYVLETLLDYPTLRAKIEAEKAAGKDYKGALETAFTDLIEKAGPAAPTGDDAPAPEKGSKGKGKGKGKTKKRN